MTQKCQYALRAVFELAHRVGQGPVKIGDIARAQAIPPRFLELILNELRQAGIVESRRGARGGYMLSVRPEELTVGRIIRLVEGPVKAVDCVVAGGRECPMRGDCAFEEMWTRAIDAMTDVFDNTTFSDLLKRDRTVTEKVPLSFSI